MSDTPRTDNESLCGNGMRGRTWVSVNFARQLERELNAANEHIKNLESALCTVENIDKVNAYQDLESANERIKRLVKAGNYLDECLLSIAGENLPAKQLWNKAKEAKL